MSKSQTEILIIDDQRARDDIYKRFFSMLSQSDHSMFEITPLLPKTPQEAIQHLDSRGPCLVVLDMVLEGVWKDYANMLYERCRAKRYSVALLSDNFNDAQISNASLDVMKALRDSPKLGFLPYTNSIRSHCVDAQGVNKQSTALPSHAVVVWNYMLLEAHGNGRHWKPAKEKEVTFLHLTDTHFGPVQPDSLNIDAMNIGARDAGLKADYVLWTGDITEHGYPSEFEAAYKFSRKLVNSGFVETSCPFSVTPGNHDLCWPLYLSSRLRIDPPPKHGDDRSQDMELKKWVVDDVDQVCELKRFGFAPFHEFFTRLVDEPLPMDGYRLLTHWVNHGFAVLELPLESHLVLSRDDPLQVPQPLVSKIDFEKITEKAIESVREARLDPSVCVIVLIHGRVPAHAASNATRWKQLVSQISRVGNSMIILGGHEHVSDHVVDNSRLMIIGSPLDQSKVEGGLSLPGVGFITLSRTADGNLQCKITKLEKSVGDSNVVSWEAKSPRVFEVLPQNGHWTDLTKARS